MYKWDAEDYHRHSRAQQGWARQLMERLGLQGHEHVLDIGCGDGKVTAEIARRVPRGLVVGIDSAPRMVAFAREHLPTETSPNLRFEIMDARSLAFEGEFDVVFSNATLHWVVDHRPVLAGIRRALRSGGRVFLEMGGRGNAAGVIAVLGTVLDDPRWSAGFTGWEFPYGFHGPEEYSAWLREAGLRPRRMELVPKDMAQKGKPGLAAWIRTTWLPYLERVPDMHREAFISLVVDRYIAAHPIDTAGVVHVAMVRLEVEADAP
jgi:trans-aconitate 2-methyltransferase